MNVNYLLTLAPRCICENGLGKDTYSVFLLPLAKMIIYAWCPRIIQFFGPNWNKFRLNSQPLFGSFPWSLPKEMSAPLVVIALSIHPTMYFRLLACVKCSVLHLEQSQWILLWTHVWRWHFRYNMDLGWHEMCPLRFLSVLNASWMTSLWSEYTWSYNGGIRREIVSSAGLDQVRKFRLQQVKLF